MIEERSTGLVADEIEGENVSVDKGVLMDVLSEGNTSEKTFSGQIAKLIDVKSITTLILTAAMVGVLFGGIEIQQDALSLFSMSYGAIITYFFTRKDK